MKKQKKKWVFGVMSQLLIQLTCLVPWIWVQEHKYNDVTWLIHVFSSGEKLGQESSLLIFLSGIIAIIQLFSLMQLVFLFRKRYKRIFDIVSSVGSLVFLMVFADLNMVGDAFYTAHAEKEAMGYATFLLVFAGVLIVVCVASLLGNYIFEVWKDTMLQYQDMKAEEKRREAERKKRLYFPGHYDKQFFSLLFKLFKQNKRGFILFAITASLTLGMVLAGIGMAEMVMPYETLGNYLNGHGIYSIIWKFIGVSTVISILLITMNLLGYLQKRMKDYGMLLSLGMRERTMHKAVFTEISGLLGISVAGGLLVGGVVLLLLRNVFIVRILSEEKLGHVGIISVMAFLGFALGVFTVAIVIVRDFLFVSSSSQKKQFVQGAEKMPGKKRIFAAFLGMYLTGSGVLQLFTISSGESLKSFFYIMLGIYLLMRNGTAIRLMDMRKREGAAYYQQLLLKNRWYYRFKTNMRVALFLVMIPVIILVIYGKNFFATAVMQSEKELFPYDFQLIIREEEIDTVQQIAEKYRGEVLILPAKRVTTVQNTPKLRNVQEVILPQGQNIGISYSTYVTLCKELGITPKKGKLKKDGSEILLVYQQDAAARMHPIDYYLYQSTPQIHMGLPLLGYWFENRDKLYPPRKIRAHQVKVLTGAYLNGLQENLVVFADDYFNKHRNDDKETNFLDGSKVKNEEERAYIYPAPDTLALLRVPKEHVKEVKEQLLVLEEAHPYESYIDRDIRTVYDSSEAKEQLGAERQLSTIVNLFTMLFMLIIGFAALYLKVMAEIKDKYNRSRFLENLGMQKKDRIRLLKQEFFTYIWIPAASGLGLGFIMTLALWWLRDYTMKQCLAYGKPLLLAVVVFYGIWIAGVKGMEQIVIQQVEGEQKE